VCLVTTSIDAAQGGGVGFGGGGGEGGGERASKRKTHAEREREREWRAREHLFACMFYLPNKRTKLRALLNTY